MQITRQADYAVRAVLHLARNTDQRTATSAIAEEQRIPPSFLCLLYTSPSPRDRTRSRMPSSA